MRSDFLLVLSLSQLSFPFVDSILRRVSKWSLQLRADSSLSQHHAPGRGHLSPRSTEKKSEQSLHSFQKVRLEACAHPEPIAGQQCCDWLDLSGSRDIPRTPSPKDESGQGPALPGTIKVPVTGDS